MPELAGCMIRTKKSGVGMRAPRLDTYGEIVAHYGAELRCIGCSALIFQIHKG